MTAVDRVTARKLAFRALRGYQRAVVEEIQQIAREVVGGGEMVVVFCGNLSITETTEYEELQSVTFASTTGKVQLSPTSGSRTLWGQSVEIWDDLRDSLMRINVIEVPLSLVVSFDRSVVLAFEPFHCPRDPDALLASMVVDLTEPDEDPFVELLAAAALDDDTADEDAVMGLLERYHIPVPTIPHPGDCMVESDLDD